MPLTDTASLGTAYNHTRFIATRRKMMQDWSDELDKLKLTG